MSEEAAQLVGHGATVRDRSVVGVCAGKRPLGVEVNRLFWKEVGANNVKSFGAPVALVATIGNVRVLQVAPYVEEGRRKDTLGEAAQDAHGCAGRSLRGVTGEV